MAARAAHLREGSLVVWAFIAVTVAVVIAFILHRLYPKTTRRWVKRIRITRQVVWGAFLLLLSLVLLRSGSVLFVVLGAFIIGYGVLLVLFEEPHEDIRNFIRNFLDL